MKSRWTSGLGLLLLVAFVAASCGGDSLRADAGDDFAVAIGESPEFDGCASVGDIEQYEWIIRQAPASGGDVSDMTLSATGSCSHVVDPMTIDDMGTWTIELIVTNDQGTAATDEVMVSVTG